MVWFCLSNIPFPITSIFTCRWLLVLGIFNSALRILKMNGRVPETFYFSDVQVRAWAGLGLGGVAIPRIPGDDSWHLH